jgi:hypothetical protein
MSEVRVDTPRFGDAELLHDHEAETVHEAVVLVGVLLKESEGGALLFVSGQLDPSEITCEESPPHFDGDLMPHFRVSMRPCAYEGDRLSHNVVRR